MPRQQKIFLYVILLSLLAWSFFSERQLFQEPPYLRLIQADRLQAQGLTGKGVTIAVIDEGFESHHPFLKDRLSSQRYNTDNHGENIGESLIYREGEFVFESHGTHISSILGSLDKRLGGIAKDSLLLPIKLGEFHGDQAIVRALDYAAQSRARIVNLSVSLSFHPAYGISPNVQKALQRLAQANKLIVIAAGNEGKPLSHSPYTQSLIKTATSPEVGGRILLVGAYEAPYWGEEHRASFSNFPDTFEAAQVFLSAPGVHIEAALSNHATGKLSGTSMAAPMVCGVAALLMERFPSYSAQKIAQLLLVGARRVNKQGHPLQGIAWGQGLLDAAKAYRYGLETP